VPDAKSVPPEDGDTGACQCLRDALAVRDRLQRDQPLRAAEQKQRPAHQQRAADGGLKRPVSIEYFTRKMPESASAMPPIHTGRRASICCS
jgi:hypothetical protein